MRYGAILAAPALGEEPCPAADARHHV